jgi:hypothetical protein
MATKLVRITTEAEGVVREYSGTDSLSQGILRMRAEIEVLEKVQEQLIKSGYSPGGASLSKEERVKSARERFMSTPVPEEGVAVVFNEAYWKRVREEVGKVIDGVSGRGV